MGVWEGAEAGLVCRKIPVCMYRPRPPPTSLGPSCRDRRGGARIAPPVVREARERQMLLPSVCFRGGPGPAFGAVLLLAPYRVERNVWRSWRSAGPWTVSRVRRQHDEAPRNRMVTRGRFAQVVITRRSGAPARRPRSAAEHGDGRYRLPERGKRSMKQEVELHSGTARARRAVPPGDCPVADVRHEFGNLTLDNTSYRASENSGSVRCAAALLRDAATVGDRGEAPRSVGEAGTRGNRPAGRHASGANAPVIGKRPPEAAAGALVRFRPGPAPRAMSRVVPDAVAGPCRRRSSGRSGEGAAR